MLQFTHQLIGIEMFQSFILLRTGQDKAMPQPKGDEETAYTIEYQAPAISDIITEEHLNITGNHHQNTLSEDRCQTIERATDAYKPCLVVLLQSQHVETIGSDIMRGTRKGHDPEKEEGELQPRGGRDGKGHATQGGTHQQLHSRNPPSFGLDDIHKRTPQGFDHPRQIKPGSVKCDISITQS